MIDLKFILFWKVVLFTITAVPISIVTNYFVKIAVNAGLSWPIVIVFTLILLGTFVCLSILFFGDDFSRKIIKDPYFYCFSLFAFISVFKLIIGLEIDGFLADFLTEYLAAAEPYLDCPYGAISCYWDGTVLYVIYLVMIFKIINNQNYRSLALYWTGQMLNSMIVLIFGVFCGKLGLYPATVLNILFMAVPVMVGWQFLQNRPATREDIPYSPLTRRPFDVFFILFLLIAIQVAVGRAATATENNVFMIRGYGVKVEPILRLDDPCPFARIQMYVNLFYMLPIYLLTIHGLKRAGCPWLLDLTLIHAGQALQSQITHMATIFHPMNPDKYRAYDVWHAHLAFWMINVMLVVLPHLILYRCLKFDLTFKLTPKHSIRRML